MIRKSMVSKQSCLAIAIGLLLVATSSQAQTYQPSFHPETLKGPPVGALNEVLVLGTAHLSNMPKTFDPETLSSLLDRLAAWHPTAIATEDMSGLQCDSLRRYPARYADTVKTYCPDPTPAGKATGLDVPAANAEAERLLASWPKAPTAVQRRHLAAVFLAAGERHSALVQWLRLEPTERHPGDGLNEDLVTALDKLKDRRNETSLIAARLAARLGLERLWSVDDHSADTPDPADPVEAKAFNDAIMQAWNNAATQARQADKGRLQDGLTKSDGILDMYRSFNAPEASMQTYQSDFGAAFMEPSPQGFGRKYLGYWETRNLRMVSNIRDVLGQYPGTRLLAIVGASHKGYYEAYLNQMHDVRLVDAMGVLK
ncbi:DUF5694 domain-containing protein [Asticcacaulis benevestitus]|uniref:DUF5694 domain-containing protein n=1 Tax=Asticcacaulis benevestitus TaxID=347481 RepID=UPI000B0C4BD8|nr:DUF5694 domain-containing protein [Asticcacaulis benevestitus]